MYRRRGANLFPDEAPRSSSPPPRRSTRTRATQRAMRAVSVKLPQLLSLLPRDGVGASVYASRWAGKGLPVPTAAPHEGDATCRWDVKKVRLVTKDGRVTGRAWGVLHWKVRLSRSLVLARSFAG